ncbi:MAG: putative bifunctional diguanylate cyclase/phosphodiesterase [Alphaproteobacteria bacterium]
MTKRRSEGPSRVAELAALLEGSLGDLANLASTLEVAHGDVSRASLLDPLTGCPNRVLFKDRVEQTLREAKRIDAKVPLLVIDLDRFKEVNETLGYRAGDDLLCEIANRLRGVLRDSDTIGRLGSDDFGILLSSAETIEGAIRVAERIQHHVESRFTVGGHTIDATMSMGVALFPVHGHDADTLLRHADMALSEARRARIPYSVFGTVENDLARSSFHLAGDLRRAVENDELVLHYQPKVAMATGCAIGVEALVRWNHPTLGLIMPGDFMPLAERTALITPLSLVILDKALRQVRLWQERGLDVPVAVNLSPRSLHQADLPDRIAESLRKTGVAADKVAIEITETAIMIDEASAESVVRRVAELGVRIAIDDFGTGYSSLTRLRRLPVSELKVDRSFVGSMARNNEDAVIVHALVDLGHRLGQSICAEGVEDEATMRMLADYACDSVQGYYLCPPRPAAGLTAWLESSISGGAPAALQRA